MNYRETEIKVNSVTLHRSSHRDFFLSVSTLFGDLTLTWRLPWLDALRGGYDHELFLTFKAILGTFPRLFREIG